MRVFVEGFGPLADGVRRACQEHHELLNTPGRAELFVVAHEGDDRHLVDKSVRNAPPRALVLILTPIASGMTARMEAAYERTIVYAPENVRSATAYEDFIDQARVVVGARDEEPLVAEFFAPFTSELVWMPPEDAEMAKHALNGFLAISVAYANEIGRLCDAYGVDPANVTYALRSDPRIGERAYVAPGGPYGKNLAREIDHLCELGVGPMVRAARESNSL